MKRKFVLRIILLVALLFGLVNAGGVQANPPAPDEPVTPTTDIQPPVEASPGNRTTGKAIDLPNQKAVEQMRLRQAQLEKGAIGPALAAEPVVDQVLVILVEFDGTDTFTWDPATSAWDPLGIADPAEYTGTVGDCSVIQTKVEELYDPDDQGKYSFTYGPTLHNTIARPLSATDRSADSIWTPDFSADWFNDFMFGDGVKFDYTRDDSSVVYEDFTGKSVRDYYLDMSGGMYDIQGEVIGWLKLPHSTWYYDADQCPGARSGASTSRGAIPGAGSARTLVKDALDLVDATYPDFDWAKYDLDGDDVIDHLWIVHAGLGEEDSTVLLNRTDYGESAVWSHSSAVTPAYAIGDSGISAGAYIMMPENGGIGVFAHEYGHNLGAGDLYAYNGGETSAGFWTLMADDWTGYPIGYLPPSVDPLHLDNWGWLNPYTISDPTQVYEFTIGQTSDFPGGDGVYRAGKIELPDGISPLAVPLWDGDHYWWGGKTDLTNGKMTTSAPIAVPAGGATLSFDLVYDIEQYWDFLWVRASTDGGSTWNYLTNDNTICDHDPDWIGELHGLPADLCAAGIGGLSGYNANWPDPEVQTFDLDAATYGGQNVLLNFWYMTDWGTAYTGPFIDNIEVKDSGAAVLFSDDAENDGANWAYDAPFVHSDGTQTFNHNLYLQFRNTTASGGYDATLGDERWRYGPANSGLVMWYNNNFYTDNEVLSYLTDFPSFGTKAQMLVIDANPTPYRDPYFIAAGYNNEGGNLAHRSLMRDAPFSLNNSVNFTYDGTAYAGRPAVPFFDDSLGYYPGAEYVSRGPGYDPSVATQWVTKQWDASAAVPAKTDYPLNAPEYTGTDPFRFDCTPYIPSGGDITQGLLSCYWYPSGIGVDGGTGNPGDYGSQYGWHVQILEQTDTTAKVRVWNSNEQQSFTPDVTNVRQFEEVTYSYEFTNQSPGSEIFACVDLDTSSVEYVDIDGPVVPLYLPCESYTNLLLQGGSLTPAQNPADVVAVSTPNLDVDEGEVVAFDITVRVKSRTQNPIEMAVKVYETFSGILVPHLLWADPVTVELAENMLFMPFINKK